MSVVLVLMDVNTTVITLLVVLSALVILDMSYHWMTKIALVSIKQV